MSSEFEFHYEKLANGLELIGEVNRSAKSVAVGFFVHTGARDEPPGLHGVSHFLEHMAFKGTPNRSAEQINREFDDIGARYNAFTSEENTVYWGAVLPEYLPKLIELLADIMRPSLDERAFEMERQVILEEIRMYEDLPSWVVYEQAAREFFGSHPLGNSVLGSHDTVARMSAEQMRQYYSQRYVAGNMFVAATGNFDWPLLCDLIRRYCDGWPAGTGQRSQPPHDSRCAFRVLTNPEVKQEHLVLISSAPPGDSSERFAADVLALLLGDATGSRLFWELVDPGLADSAETDYHEFQGTGTFSTYVSCSPERARENLERVRAVFRQLIADGVADEELRQVKSKANAQLVLRSERPMGRLVPLAYNWVYGREYRTVEQDIEAVNAVDRDQICQLLDRYPLQRCTVVALGPLEETELQP